MKSGAQMRKLQQESWGGIRKYRIKHHSPNRLVWIR